MEPLDFKRLYDIVTERGGFGAVCDRHEWNGVYDRMKIAHKSTSGVWNIRMLYQRYSSCLALFPFFHSPTVSPSPVFRYLLTLETEFFKVKGGKVVSTKREKEVPSRRPPAKTELKSSNRIFEPEEMVQVRHRPSGKLYVAKVLKFESAEERARKQRTEGKKPEGRYFVHYKGWKTK